MFDGKRILITGGTGTFGENFTKHLLNFYNPEKIIIFSIKIEIEIILLQINGLILFFSIRIRLIKIKFQNKIFKFY